MELMTRLFSRIDRIAKAAVKIVMLPAITVNAGIETYSECSMDTKNGSKERAPARIPRAMATDANARSEGPEAESRAKCPPTRTAKIRGGNRITQSNRLSTMRSQGGPRTSPVNTKNMDATKNEMRG